MKKEQDVGCEDRCGVVSMLLIGSSNLFSKCPSSFSPTVKIKALWSRARLKDRRKKESYSPSSGHGIEMADHVTQNSDPPIAAHETCCRLPL